MGQLLNLAKFLDKSYTFVQAQNTLGVDATFLNSFVMVVEATVSTPTNKTFAAAAVNTGTDTITVVAHGYALGLKVQISNPGTLPTGISASTDYFVIPLTVDTFQLASSLVLANAGTQIDITAAGAGTNTVNVTALAGASAVLQRALVNSTVEADWSNDGSAVNITGAGNTYFEASGSLNPTGNFYRIKYAITAGQLTAAVRVLGKGLA